MPKHRINLQNIPIRSELGRQIRQGFTTKSAVPYTDYDCIERRIFSRLYGKDRDASK